MSPTARALKDLRAMGFVAEKVEQRLPRMPNVTRDFIGCIDIIAFSNSLTVGIQATSGANHAARVAKAKAEPRLRQWLASDARSFAVWSYAKRGGRGKRKLWTRRTEVVSSWDIDEANAAPAPVTEDASAAR